MEFAAVCIAQASECGEVFLIEDQEIHALDRFIAAVAVDDGVERRIVDLSDRDVGTSVDGRRLGREDTRQRIICARANEDFLRELLAQRCLNRAEDSFCVRRFGQSLDFFGHLAVSCDLRLGDGRLAKFYFGLGCRFALAGVSCISRADFVRLAVRLAARDWHLTDEVNEIRALQEARIDRVARVLRQDERAARDRDRASLLEVLAILAVARLGGFLRLRVIKVGAAARLKAMLWVVELLATRFRLCGVVFLIDGLRAVSDGITRVVGDNAAQLLNLAVDALDVLIDGAQLLDGRRFFRLLDEFLLARFFVADDLHDFLCVHVLPSFTFQAFAMILFLSLYTSSSFSLSSDCDRAVSTSLRALSSAALSRAEISVSS